MIMGLVQDAITIIEQNPSVDQKQMQLYYAVICCFQPFLWIFHANTVHAALQLAAILRNSIVPRWHAAV